MHVGLDAGNSKTVALVCSSLGEVLGYATAGSGDIYGALDAAHAENAVVVAVKQALDSAGVSMEQVDSAAFRIAGIDWPEDQALWERAVAVRLPGLCRPSILNDGYAPIRCVHADGVGVAVVAGTGPALAARGPSGAQWALSWWAQDELGAAGMGGAALRAVFRHDLGLGPATALREALLARYEVADAESLLHEFTRREGRRTWQDKGRAARQVLAAALSGDAVAREIVCNQARAFARYARVAAGKVGFDPDRDPVRVVLAGSVLTAPNSPMVTELVDALAAELPYSQSTVSHLPPVAGAALDAIAESGATVDLAITEKLYRTIPAGVHVQT